MAIKATGRRVRRGVARVLRDDKVQADQVVTGTYTLSRNFSVAKGNLSIDRVEFLYKFCGYSFTFLSKKYKK